MLMGMKINNVDLSSYKAKLVDMNIGSTSTDMKWEFLNNGALLPVRTSISKGHFLPISLEIEIIADSRAEFEQLKSNMSGEFIECTVTFDDIPGKIYTGYRNGEVTVTKEMPGIGTVAVNLLTICEGYEVSESFTKTLTTYIKGNLSAPAILEITTATVIQQLAITGLGRPININSNVSGIAKDIPLIIDGRKCQITQNGVNMFGVCEIWGFPEVVPGGLTITLSEECAATLKYKPRFN